MPFSAGPIYALYIIFWMCACVLLGLIAYQIDLNYTKWNVYEDILEELLVTTAMSIAWVPISAITIRLRHRNGASIMSFEVIGAVTLWIMYLVGAAYFTNKVFDGKGDCTPEMSDKDCDIMTTILAFSWIEFSLMTFITGLSLSRIDNSPSLPKKVGQV